MKVSGKKKKAIVLSLAMSVALSVPLVASAQDGLFQHGAFDETYYGFGSTKESTGLLGNRSVQTSGTIDNQIFGQPVPVGCGIIVLLAAGAGYAILKRKEDEQ
jgi:hypothetical protein